MKGFLQEYGIIMVVVAVVLGMLAFGKTGYAKSIQDAILGSADHIVETGESVTKGSEVKSSDLLNIEGKEYVVLEKQGNSQAVVMTVGSIGNEKFGSMTSTDGHRAETYEGSEIDNYLENKWYNSLSSTMKAAIQPTNIKQDSYKAEWSWSYDGCKFIKQETAYNGQVYNTISRHVFLPSVSEIGKVVDLKNPDKLKAFLNGIDISTRDNSGSYEVIFLDATGILNAHGVNNYIDTRPAFTVDLSKVDYKVTGHVDYK